MKKIYKYHVGIVDHQVIEMSRNAQILSVQFQDGILCMWALVNPDEPKVAREFAVIGTGNLFNTKGMAIVHIASCQDSTYVWHIFDLGEGK